MMDIRVGILYKVADNQILLEEEKQVLADWLTESPHNRQLFEEIVNKEKLERDLKETMGYDGREIWAKVRAGIAGRKRGDDPSGQWRYVVLLLLLLSAVAWFFIQAVGR